MKVSILTTFHLLQYLIQFSNATKPLVCFVPSSCHNDRHGMFEASSSKGCRGYVKEDCRVRTAIFAKGSKSSSPGSTVSKKVQVKLLKHVTGTGQAGEIVQVTPAFFQNKLRPSKAAIMITDEEVAREKLEAMEGEKRRHATAIEIKEKAESDLIKMKRKAGPDGNLFGGIGHKAIMTELMSRCSSSEFLEQKNVKITSILDGSGKPLKGDIKEVGNFTAILSLTKTVEAKIAIKVQPEK